MARIPKITRSNPLSQFTNVAPSGGIMFSVMAQGFDELYSRVEPVALQKLKTDGARMGREEARRQIGTPAPVIATPQPEAPAPTPDAPAPDAPSDVVPLSAPPEVTTGPITDTPPVPGGASGGNRGGRSAGNRISTPVRDTITAAANKYGQDPEAMLTIAWLESRGDPNAKNPNSSAEGLFQFINSTAKAYGLTNKRDAGASSDAGARLLRDNREGLKKRLGREPTTGELYLAHQQGLGGARKLLSNPGASAVSLVGADAVKLNGGNASMTGQEFANLWVNKANNAAAGGGRSGSSSSGNAVSTEASPAPVSMIQKSDGSFEARKFSPYSGPLLQAHNQAANAAYASEMLNTASTDILSMSQSFLLDPEGFGQAAEGYINQMVDAAPEMLQEGLRSTLNDAVLKRQRGIMADKQADIRDRASNSNKALVDRYSDELADALASGDQTEIDSARSLLDGVLQVREGLPGLAWTDEQSANVFIGAQKSADARRATAAKKKAADDKDSLDLIIKAAKAGLAAADEGKLMDPAIVGAHPELAAEAAAFVTLRDQMPEFLTMTPGQQQQAVADLKEQDITAEWQLDLLGAMETTTRENRKAWRDDPIKRAGEALPNTPPPPLPELSPDDPDSFVSGLKARREYANDLVEQGYTDVPAFFSEDETTALKTLFGKGSPPEVRAAAAAGIVTGFGDDAVRAFNEIDADPLTMFAGKMMAKGGNPVLAGEMLRGQVMLDEGHVVVPPSSDRVEAFNSAAAEALVGVPNALGVQTELMKGAQAIYAARAQGVDPKSEAATELMGQAIQAALGQATNKRGQLTGGVQEVAGNSTLLPVGMAGEDVSQALTMALTGLPHGGGFRGGMGNLGAALSGDTLDPEQRADLWEQVGGQPMLNGFPIDPGFVTDGSVRLVSAGGSQYRIEIVSGDIRLDAEDANGDIFFFDINRFMEVAE